MNKLELLSPAGDLQIFKSVIDAGADAVYFGGDLFGARAYAKNFSMEDGAEAIKYAHIHGAKAYLTVNTLLKNLEIEKNLYNYLKEYVENGIDAFIVQDMGVFSLIRDCFCDTHIHVSTQVSLCTEYGAAFFEKNGAKRIVTAREIGIDEISAIHQKCPDLEIESFVHGALCVCFSGQCLMSSILGGRSGNRGRCAQPCRLPYDAYDVSGRHLNKKGNYILSPKDFCTINSLPEMIDAGVVSFKVEGRMKKLDYACGVISVYREYIDKYLYQGAKNYSVDNADIEKLLGYGNRSGFTDLYLHDHNGPEMITFDEPSHKKDKQVEVIVSPKKLPIKCKVKAVIGEEFCVTFYDEEDRKGVAYGNIVEAASKKPTTFDDIKKAVSGLGNTQFELSDIHMDCDDNIFLPVSVIKNARRSALEQYTSLAFSKINYTIREFNPRKAIDNKSNYKPDLFVSVTSMEQYKAVLEYDFIKKIAVSDSLFEEAYSYNHDVSIYIYMPSVLRKDCIPNIKIDKKASGVIARSMDEIGYLDEMGYNKDNVLIDHRLYTCNNRSIDTFKKWGYSYSCIPYELSIKELKYRDNANSQLVIYSRIPMMVTANCTLKNTIGCKKNNDVITLVDRKGESFIVGCNCKYCYNTIYNGKKYIAFDLRDEIYSLGVKELRLDFTFETYDETKSIMDLYENVFVKNMPFKFEEAFTKGHLKRGVE